MNTALDTNVLLDLLLPGQADARESLRQIRAASEDGLLIICDPVLAELSGRFHRQADLDTFLSATRIGLVTSGATVLFRAGQAWNEYRSRRRDQLTCSNCGAAQSAQCGSCGRPITSRQNIVADFIIGAHALEHADRLLTRDRGYFHTYFPELPLA